MTLHRIMTKARKEALGLVEREVMAVLPKGWVVHLAVGWGLTVYDHNGKTVIGSYTEAPRRFPRGVRRALLIAAEFCEMFGYGNEQIGTRL